MHRTLPPSSLLVPVPVVMVSCASDRPDVKPNIITIAWAGTVCTKPPMVSISVRKSRYSYDIIKETGEFAVNLVAGELAGACDFCGVKSGRDVDKFASCSLTPAKVRGLSFAVGIAESPLILGCKVKQTIELGTHDMFIAEIVSAAAKEELFDGSGKLCLDKANLVSYIHGDYYETGKRLGFFGWSVASKKALKRRNMKTRLR